ncbi:hypothetical protein N0V95_007649 [Ascochyta clinopodiicola]|nr:hypothetical protein N0V95_007649 [Ascochyta clinopodiicola]
MNCDIGHVYFVHRDLIIAHSEFFQKAMSGDWKEAQERKVSLPDDKAETFDLYLQLLYASAFLTPLKAVRSKNTQTKKLTILKERYSFDSRYCRGSKLYVLAKKLMDETTKSVVLAALTARSQTTAQGGTFSYPRLDAVQPIYAGTPPSSPARQLLVRLQPKQFLVNSNNVLKEFLLDLSASLLSAPTAPPECCHVQAELEDVKAELARIKEAGRKAEKDIEMLSDLMKKCEAVSPICGL